MGGWLAPRFQARCIIFCMIVWAGGSSLEVAPGAAGSRRAPNSARAPGVRRLARVVFKRITKALEPLYNLRLRLIDTRVERRSE